MRNYPFHRKRLFASRRFGSVEGVPDDIECHGGSDSKWL
jgi:hypothetical protein